MKLLQQLSVFKRIAFVESTHCYLIDGSPTNAPSVTQLLKRFKTQFDAEKISARVAKKLNVSQAQLLEDWEQNKVYSSTLGTIVHKYAENYYNNKRVDLEASNFSHLWLEDKQRLLNTLPILIKQFQNFYNDHCHLLNVKNEMVLGDVDDTKVCGTIDMLAYNTQTDSFEILDFKTNKKIATKSSYGKLKYPYDDLSEGQFNEYAIQLNTYKYILEKYTDCKIDKLKLIWLTNSNDQYEVIELPFLQDRIKLMFDVYKSSSLFEEK